MRQFVLMVWIADELYLKKILLANGRAERPANLDKFHRIMFALHTKNKRLLFLNCRCMFNDLFSCHLLDDKHSFQCVNYFVIGGIRTSSVSNDPILLWISLHSCPLNLLLSQSHQAEIIIEESFTQKS